MNTPKLQSPEDIQRFEARESFSKHHGVSPDATSVAALATETTELSVLERRMLEFAESVKALTNENQDNIDNANVLRLSRSGTEIMRSRQRRTEEVTDGVASAFRAANSKFFSKYGNIIRIRF